MTPLAVHTLSSHTFFKASRGHFTCQPSCGLRGEAGLIIPEEAEEDGVRPGMEGAGSGGGDEGRTGPDMETWGRFVFFMEEMLA